MSNIHKFYDRETIAAEAREWLIRLDGDSPPTGEEMRALGEWVGRSPLHRQELKRISTFWDSANILTELAIPLRKNETRRSQGIFFGLFARHRVVTAASALLLSFIVIYLSWDNPAQPVISANGMYGTGIGQQQTVVLADGSEIRLNTDSLVEVEYSKAARKVRLLRGESLFNVVHDTTAAFEVHAYGNMVRAIGTAFSVRLLEDDVKVTVAEGKVELITVKNLPEHMDTDTIADRTTQQRLGFLEHGQSTTFNNATSSISTLAEQELARELAWRDGFLSFSGEPLSEVIKEINRYTPRIIEIADPELEALPVGGRFRVDDLDAMLDVLEASFGIKSEQIDDQHILLRVADKYQ